MDMDISRLIDLYQRRREQREPRLRSFLELSNPAFLVVQTPAGDFPLGIMQRHRHDLPK